MLRSTVTAASPGGATVLGRDARTLAVLMHNTIILHKTNTELVSKKKKKKKHRATHWPG